jgi:hypothetical protein
MTYDFDSIAECTSAPAIAQLGGKRTTNFLPLLPATYQDAEGMELEAKPDFLIQRPRCFTFIDTKSGKLNNHYTRSSSREALADAYLYHLHRLPDGMSHSALSKELYNSTNMRGTLAVMEHGFNHSRFKQAAVQAKQGWQRFLVVFKASPSKAAAKRYLDAGLVFCTVKTLPDLMNTIELLQRGWNIPFVFKGPGYSFTVSADPATEGFSCADVEYLDRAKFLAALAADEEAVAAQQAKQAEEDEARLAAGFPF